MKFSKVLFVALAGYGTVWILNYLLGLFDIRLGSVGTLILYSIISLAVLYFPAPKRNFPARKTMKIEYMVNGQGQLTSKVFNSGEYSDYSEVERNSEGRILADPTGKIICTRYAISNENIKGMSRTQLVFLCLVCISLSVMLENLFLLVEAGCVNSILTRWAYRKVWLNPEFYGIHIKNNVLSAINALSRVQLNIDFSLCFEIIKDNLERFSILQFN